MRGCSELGLKSEQRLIKEMKGKGGQENMSKAHSQNGHGINRLENESVELEGWLEQLSEIKWWRVSNT